MKKIEIKKKEQINVPVLIDNLQKENITQALYSIALTFIVELSYFLLSVKYKEELSEGLFYPALLIPLAYFLYMTFCIYRRNQKIKKLAQSF